MKNVKITKGVWHDSSKEVFCPNQIGIMVHGTLENRLERNFIRHLITDAGNTYQSCSLLPSELLKQRDELLEALKELMEGVRGLPPLTAIAGVLTKQYEKAQQAITKAEER